MLLLLSFLLLFLHLPLILLALLTSFCCYGLLKNTLFSKGWTFWTQWSFKFPDCQKTTLIMQNSNSGTVHDTGTVSQLWIIRNSIIIFYDGLRYKKQFARTLRNINSRVSQNFPSIPFNISSLHQKLLSGYRVNINGVSFSEKISLLSYCSSSSYFIH